MAVMEEKKVRLDTQELADLVGVSHGYVSRAMHNDWLAGGVRVKEYAVMHWKGNRVSHYEVPVSLIKDLAPRHQWEQFGISRY